MTPARTPVSRRSLLLAAGALCLSGCGVRLERDAPSLPLVSPRAVDPRAVVTYVELRRVRDALAAARAVGQGRLAERGATLAGLHAQQEGVLAARLRELGEDPADAARLDPVATAAGLAPRRPGAGATSGGTGATGAGGSQDASGAVAAPSLPAAEAAGLARADLARLGELPADELGLQLSLRVQRAVALPLVGGVLDPWPAPVVASPDAATRLVAALRSAEYALEVALARVPPAGARAELGAGLAWARGTRLQLASLAGTQAPPAADGYALPFPVHDAASAARLGQVALTGLADAALAGGGEASGQGPQLCWLLALAAQAEQRAAGLGAPLRAFPGLRQRRAG